MYFFGCHLTINYCSMHGFGTHKANKSFVRVAVQLLWINANQNSMHE